MNYLKIIVKGYFDKINRKFLKEYFLREFKKAEKEYFSPEVFFTGCLTVVQELEEHIKAKLHDRKEYLQRQINDAKNGLSQYRDMEGKTIEQQRQETIENCTLQLSRLSEDDISIQPNEIAKLQLPAPIYKKDLLIIKRAIQEAQSNIEQHQQKAESSFSVLEWATIFYYADETKLLPESHLLKTRMDKFMSKNKIGTTFNYFRKKYYQAKKRINEKNNYPINKLKLIIPFLKENYKQTVTKVENDIIFLEENKSEY